MSNSNGVGMVDFVNVKLRSKTEQNASRASQLRPQLCKSASTAHFHRHFLFSRSGVILGAFCDCHKSAHLQSLIAAQPPFSRKCWEGIHDHHRLLYPTIALQNRNIGQIRDHHYFPSKRNPAESYQQEDHFRSGSYRISRQRWTPSPLLQLRPVDWSIYSTYGPDVKTYVNPASTTSVSIPRRRSNDLFVVPKERWIHRTSASCPTRLRVDGAT